ncbi:MAG TPA: MarR family transcriptional regulator [Actinoplanes sp.]|nr:MarR family transcriptional regulator [Actinoplanes sp.]
MLPGTDLLQLLRRYTDAHLEMTRHLARELGVHVTDAVAVAEILWASSVGEPLSPASLAERVGLTSGATANLLNRLESAGHIVRSREDADRRVVRLRLTPAAHATTTTFFTPSAERLDAALRRYDDADLELMERLLADLVGAIADHNARLRARG